jgi:D-threo-aldose 1-dehydrogenase
MIGGPYNSGILATGAVAGARFDYAPASSHTMRRVRMIQAVCARHNAPLAAAALQFPYAHDAVAAVIPGARGKSDVVHNVALLQTTIDPNLWRDLKSEGLLRGDAPCPGH